ncbi:MAG: hypothetical protein WD114_01165 [Phycisphaerales bacterium]
MFRFTIAAGLLLSLAGTAQAGVVNIMGDSSTSNENTGASFAGTLEYTATGGSQGLLSVSITNTTAGSVGGFLTGFVFDIASMDSGASATLSSASNNNFKNTGTENAMPFGVFDAGAAVKANWQGGGAPNKGLGIGFTGLFEFIVSASDAAALTSMDFLGEGTDFAVRFRGLEDGGSDKLLAGEQPPMQVIPLPTGFIAGAGMLGLCLGVRAIRRR